MPATYWFGLATIPTILGAGWLLWQAGRLVNRVGEATFKRIAVGSVSSRARFGAVAASIRRAHLFTFGGMVLMVGAGYDRSQIEPLHAAIAAVIGPKLTRVAPGTRTPHDPGVVYAEED